MNFSHFLFAISCLPFLSLTPLQHEGGANLRTGSPSGLMVEFIREPQDVPVLDLNPEFSWIVPSDTKFQTGYQILMASTKEKLEKDIADVWDSKMTSGNRSSEVESGSKDLAANTTYFWKVRIWNDQSKPSEYSGIQSFTTGNPHGYETTRNKFQTRLIRPETLVKISDGHYFADFG